jgi:acyl-CoA synthetase (AMP-forming)/AMP-acid ligase II
MDKIFLVDKNIITYNGLIHYINGQLDLFESYSEMELFFLDTIKSLTNGHIVKDWDDLIVVLKGENQNIKLFSSGTTGEPKIIYQSFKNMIRNVRVGNIDSVWSMFYHPNRMAGYQVLFQSLLNKNTLVNMFRYDFKDVQDRLQRYKVTHISATPTLYKMILGPTFESVKQITFGGEGSTKDLRDKVSKYFPNARVKNIYASTEGGSLLATNTDLFNIPMDKIDKIKIINNEIHLHKDIVGESHSIKLEGNWYNTGDVVEFSNPNQFKIVGRSSNILKIAGYNVNIEVIESKIQQLDGVKLCKVSSKENSVLGNILICELVAYDGHSLIDIKRSMKSKLEKYEIPTKITFVESIEISENGKIKR